MSKPHTHALCAAALLAATAAAQAGVINLDTGQDGWVVSFATPVGAETDAAMNYSCLGAGAPMCMSITSNGFADGTWIHNVGPELFNGEWTARIAFDLPAGATQARLDYGFLGVDDYVELYTDAVEDTGVSTRVAAATIFQLPSGSVALGGRGGARYSLEMRVRNNGSDPFGPPVPITAFDGTAVVSQLRVVFDDAGTVPEPGTWALVGPAGLALWLSRRRRTVAQR